jgi:hypothetical protein
MLPVICGAIIGICILRIRDNLVRGDGTGLMAGAGLRSQSGSRSITQELYSDLTRLFRTNYRFTGYLEPLNNVNVLKDLVMVEDSESYTINKRVIHLCTRDPRNGKRYDKNTLMFVVLHELAHVLCPEIGHTNNFLNINTALLQYAASHGFYDPTKPFIKNYCQL